MYGGAVMAVGETLVCVRNALPPLWIGVILVLHGWSQAGHSQRYGPPELVIPLRVTDTGIGMKSQGWLSYSMHFGGQKQVVHMKVNKHLLSRNLQVFTYTDQGAPLMEQPFIQNDCYYRGFVEGYTNSLVALSTCLRGFQGILQINDIVFEIEPKQLSTTFEHLVYKINSEETKFPTMRCGLTDEETARQLKFQESVHFTLMRGGYKDWWTHKRFLELALVVDHNRYLYRNSNTSDVQSEVCLVANEVNNLLNSLNVNVVLMGIEIWTEKNPVPTDTMKAFLPKFCKWKQMGFNNRLPHDVAHAFVKKKFGITLGLAYVGGACKYHFNCGVESFMGKDTHGFSHVVAHEIGHNIGMDHDVKTCVCELKSCIMAEYHSLTNRFSNCSYAEFINTIQKLKCLYTSSNTQDIITLTQCGNSVVEQGEECDCGALHLCEKDPCCQPNCTLRSGATCAFGLCCKDCQIMPTGTVCRQEENECDLPEWCNGTSYHCPEDTYVQNGSPCKGGGYCYEKRCNNREEQCKKIFGKAAKSAHQTCYTKINTQGDRFGNCGIRGTSYVRCEMSDSLCGRVQCENVTELPLLRDHSTVHCTHFNGVTCWGTDYHLGMTIPDVGDVRDGTECDAKHVCIKRKCVPMSLLESNCSPATCNMKGVCNNRQNCHCNYKWDPPNCLKRGSGGSIDSGPPPNKYKMEKYLTLLTLIPFFILLCFFFGVFMKRRRTENNKEQDVPASSK